MSIESEMPFNHCILCRPLLSPSVFPIIKVFSNESALRIRWPKYWGFSFSISPSNEYSRLISFNIDWFELCTVQGTLKSLLQHSLEASILQHSALFMVWCSHLYVTTGKTTALTIWTFVSKVMSLLFNMECLRGTDLDYYNSLSKIYPCWSLVTLYQVSRIIRNAYLAQSFVNFKYCRRDFTGGPVV